MDDIAYLGYIASHYNEIKHCVDLESIKTFGHESNEDIFHDTILKCMSCSGKLLSESQIKNYIFISYKTNFKRELDYARNKNRDEDVELQDLDELDFDRSLIDYNTIKNLVIDKFGEKEWILFEDFIYGSSIQDICKECKEKGLYYRFNKIKAYVKRFIQK